MARFLNESCVFNSKLYDYSPLTLAGSILMLVRKTTNKQWKNNMYLLDVDWKKAADCFLELEKYFRGPFQTIDHLVLEHKYHKQLINFKSLLGS